MVDFIDRAKSMLKKYYISKYGEERFIEDRIILISYNEVNGNMLVTLTTNFLSHDTIFQADYSIRDNNSACFSVYKKEYDDIFPV